MTNPLTELTLIMDSYGWIAVAALYGLALLGLMTYGFHCYAMIVLFLRRHKVHRLDAQEEIDRYNEGRQPADYPMVTLQLPIYNEREVVRRLLQSLCKLDYPRDRFQVQVLDDSTDDSTAMVDRAARELADEGIDIEVVRRAQRTHFKAGALANGLGTSKGDYVAIFDSDFLIPPHFLKRAVALLEPHPDVACVQGRWGHLNRHENWLTRAQSVGIDGHFAAEQGARGYSSLCLNFNGTAGIWRQAAIEAAGGWSGDTLTEDLDLSYRAQLAGYRLRYDLDLECPAEIPNNVMALKSQQSRWAKGSIQTAIKLLPSIWRSSRLGLLQKAEASLHLTHYMVAVFMCLLCLLTLPMLMWTPLPTLGWVLSILWLAIIASALAPCAMYTGSGFALRRGWFSFSHFPAMLVLGTGLCLNNAKAVLEALLGQQSDFIRTPKSGSTNELSKVSSYGVDTSTLLGGVELVLGLYCWATLYVYLGTQKYLFGVFLAAYAIGFTTFGLLTLRHCLPRLTWRPLRSRD